VIEPDGSAFAAAWASAIACLSAASASASVWAYSGSAIQRVSAYEMGYTVVPGVCFTVTVTDETPGMSVAHTSTLY
jgi:hypothetical protein